MKTDASSFDSITSVLLLAAGALAVYGVLNNLLLVGVAFLIAGIAFMRRVHLRKLGVVSASFGIVFSAVVFSYGVGKDMAQRDNALNNSAQPAKSTAG